MPAQKGKQSGLMAKYGAAGNKAVAEHANDETTYGFQRLPGGISNGIARLTKLYFDTHKEGDLAGHYYLRGEGTVVIPKTHKDPLTGVEVTTEGMSTSMMISLAPKNLGKDNERTVEMNIKEALNEVRKLAGDAATQGMTDLGQVEAILPEILEAAPYFYFETSPPSLEKKFPPGHPQAGEVQYAGGRVWERWRGGKGLEDYSPPDDQAVEDNTPTAAGPAPGRNGTAKPVPAKAPAGKGKPATPPVPPPGDYTDAEDLDALAATADGDEDKDPAVEPARQRLNELATEAGISEDDVLQAPSFAAVVELIRGAGDAAGAEAGDPSAWQAGEMAFMRPLDPKTRKPAAKGKRIQVELTSSIQATRACTVKDAATGKPVNDPVTKRPALLSWDDLATEP